MGSPTMDRVTRPPARIVHRIDAKSPEPYLVYVLRRDGTRGYELAVDPLPVGFEGLEDYDTFSHRFDGGYRVSERLTGLAIVARDGLAPSFGTRGEAIGAAAEYLGRWGVAEFVRSVVAVLNGRGGGHGRS